MYTEPYGTVSADPRKNFEDCVRRIELLSSSANQIKVAAEGLESLMNAIIESIEARPKADRKAFSEEVMAASSEMQYSETLISAQSMVCAINMQNVEAYRTVFLWSFAVTSPKRGLLALNSLTKATELPRRELLPRVFRMCPLRTSGSLIIGQHRVTQPIGLLPSNKVKEFQAIEASKGHNQCPLLTQ